MGAKGITFAEEGHIVNALSAIDVNAGAQTSNFVSLENYAHASIIITMGVVTDTTLIKLYQAKTSGGGSQAFMGFDYYEEKTDSGDTLTTRITVGVGGFSTGTENDTTFVIEVDAAELSPDFKYLAILTNAPGNAFISVVVILTGSRYASDPLKRQTVLT